MPSKIAGAFQSYNKTRDVYSSDNDAALEREYQDSIAGGVIPWFLGLDKREKWTARWLSENGLATIIFKSPDCGCDGTCCSAGVISAGPGKPVLKLPTKLELTRDEFAQIRREQRSIVHPILTEELLRVLEAYSTSLEENCGKVHYSVLDKAKSVRDLCLGKKVSASAFQSSGPRIESDFVEKVKNCLEDYGWRVGKWKLVPSGAVLCATDRLCSKADKDGILFELLYDAVHGIQQDEGIQLEILPKLKHGASVAQVARKVRPSEIREYKVRRTG
jgi:hypothetical protein